MEEQSVLPASPLRFGFFVSKRYWPWMIGAILAVATGSTLDGLTTIALGNLIDAIPSRNSVNMLHWATLYAIIFSISGIIWRVSGFTGMQWMTRSRAYAYKTLFAYLTHHSANYFNNRFAGALTNKIANVADGTSNILQNILWEFLPLVSTVCVSIYVSLTVNPLFGVIICAWTALYIVINVYLVLRKRKFAIQYAENTSRMRGAMVDSASNIAAVHQSARQEHEISYLQNEIDTYAASGLRNWFRSEWILFTGNVLQAILVGIILWLSIFLLMRQLMTVGEVAMILGLVRQLVNQIFGISNDLNRFTDNYGQASEGLQELLVPHEIVDEPEAETLTIHEGAVTFRDVTFAYGQQKVFDHFSVSIKPGQKVGLVGQSGAGKTSLTSILLRQYDIQSGDILIDNQNIRTITQKSLRQHIAIVPQDTSLFHRTILENIRYGRLDASDDAVKEAAKLAQADTFILAAPKGYDTLVGERGVKLSGGQRQRISIARAILKNAPILVLDEATSALDSESEAAIQQALQRLMKGKTVLAIAHRLSTLRMMDRIIVLDKGTIVEDGTHDELVARKGIYARLWESQVKGFIQE